MSIIQLPVFPGVGWDIKKFPEYKTIVQEAAMGAEYRNPLYAQPRWKFTLPMGYLLDDVLGVNAKTLQAFVMAQQGQYGAFLYLDPYDNAVTNYQFGTGDGATATFPLTRPVGDGSTLQSVERLMWASTITTVTVNGTPTSAYTSANPPANITFNSAPAAAAVLRWTGVFMFLCRFDKDAIEMVHMDFGHWGAELTFQSLLLPG